MSVRVNRVLIVDDEPLIRWALTQTLTESGCEVVEAADARSALEALSKAGQRFEVVVLDYRLPDVGDLSLLAATKRLCPEGRVIMMAACMDPDEATRALEMGASHVIEKPFPLGALAALVIDDRGETTSQTGGCREVAS